MQMCIYVYMSTQACDMWKCTRGFYCVDVLHLPLKCRFSRVTFFFLSHKKANDEVHSWKSCNLMLDLGYLSKKKAICFLSELNLWIIIAGKNCYNGQLGSTFSTTVFFFGPLFVMVNGFPNYFYLKLCQIFIIRHQTTWTLPTQKRAEMNQEWKQSAFSFLPEERWTTFLPQRTKKLRATDSKI